jgi:uncharacterized protein YaeQ
MAETATIYKLTLELSDISRGVYESLNFRVAQHPSEGLPRLVTRILAYALFYEEGLEFGRGISDADEPALWTHDLTGQLLHWIDVGTPGADRIHLASKKAPRVSILCHKGEDAFARETSKRKLHRAEDINVVMLEPKFVDTLSEALTRTSEWTVVINEGDLTITIGEVTFMGTARQVSLPQP